jgi:uncharacterized protein YneF (UPF0154 family)
MSKQRIWFIGLALLTGILVFVFIEIKRMTEGLNPRGCPQIKSAQESM